MSRADMVRLVEEMRPACGMAQMDHLGHAGFVYLSARPKMRRWPCANGRHAQAKCLRRTLPSWDNWPAGSI